MNSRNSEQQYPVGIDLGTTESVLAYVDESGNALTWKGDDATALNTSAVAIGKEILVGNKAVELGSQVIENFKREMGKQFCQTSFPDLRVPPEVLSGFVLQHLRDRAQTDIGPITDVVISVPAYFDAKRRLATKEAGRLAGLNVVSIINEPTAASIGYCFQEGLLLEKEINKNILVYDFGGGTFDVTLLKFDRGTFRTLASDGDVRLGGHDIDLRLAEYMAQQFEIEFKIDPRRTHKSYQDLIKVAREAKIALSKADSYIATVTYEIKQKKVVLRRDIYNFLIEPFIERTLATCEDVLYDSSNMNWSDLDTILLVGGTTQIPFISQKLHELAGFAPTTVENPQELVALGCSLYAANLSPNHSLEFDIANVNSHSLGIRGREVDSGQPMNKVLVPRNSKLPTSVKKKFVTFKKNQRAVKLVLLEGESENPDLCYEVGRFKVALGVGVPKGEKIEVLCDYQQDGTIHVSARLLRADSMGMLEIESSNIKNDSLDEWRSRLLSGTLLDASDSNQAFDDEDFLNDDALYGGFSELEELDHLYHTLGTQLAASELPEQHRAQQRLANELGAEIKKMGRLIDKLRARIESLDPSSERKELQAILEELNSFESLKRKAHNHALVSLGRECRRNSIFPYEGTNLIENMEKLELKVMGIWS